MYRAGSWSTPAEGRGAGLAAHARGADGGAGRPVKQITEILTMSNVTIILIMILILILILLIIFIWSSRMWCLRMWCLIIIVVSPSIMVNATIMFGKRFIIKHHVLKHHIPELRKVAQFEEDGVLLVRGALR